MSTNLHHGHKHLYKQHSCYCLNVGCHVCSRLKSEGRSSYGDQCSTRGYTKSLLRITQRLDPIGGTADASCSWRSCENSACKRTSMHTTQLTQSMIWLTLQDRRCRKQQLSGWSVTFYPPSSVLRRVGAGALSLAAMRPSDVPGPRRTQCWRESVGGVLMWCDVLRSQNALDPRGRS